MTITKSAALKAEHSAQWERNHAALCRQVKEEFAKGMRVSWTHTYRPDRSRVLRSGIVESVDDYQTVYIRMKENGPLHQIKGWLLDIEP
jgi:inner membrane protein involved in colicin E2 resistance